MKKVDKIESYITIYALIFALLCVVAFGVFLICTPPVVMVLHNPNGIIAFAICYPVAIIILPAAVFAVYCGYQYIKEEISEIKKVRDKEEEIEKKLKELYKKESDEFLKKSKGGHI